MICIRRQHGKAVRVPAPSGVSSGTLTWRGGELEVPAVGGELVISEELAARVPRPEKILGETHCLLTAGSEQCMVIYIRKPREAIKRWRSI